jgi:hypothetical protein
MKHKTWDMTGNMLKYLIIVVDGVSEKWAAKSRIANGAYKEDVLM